MQTKPILVVMAAGMGSRYGGLKQIDPVGSQGEAILDYSLYDAQLAVAEAVKRQLDRRQTALIIAECGSGKSVRRS